MVSPLKKQISLLKKRKKSNRNKKNNKTIVVVGGKKSKTIEVGKKSKTIEVECQKKKLKNKIKKKSDVQKKRKQRRVLDGQNYTIKKTSPETNKKWIIYSLDGCPFCTDAKKLLTSKNIDFDFEEFANLTPEKQKQIEADIDKQKLAKITDVKEAQRYKDNPFRTYPRIFKSDGEFIGGYNDTRLYFEN